MKADVLTLTDYARHLGVSRQRVSQYKAEGRLDDCFTMKGRTVLVNVTAADTKLKGTFDLSQKIKAAIPNAKKIKTIQQAGLDISQCDYQASRTLNEYYKAALKKLEYDVKTGQLLDKKEVEKQAFECARDVRDALLVMPSRLSAILSAESDMNRVESILREEITNCLIALSE